MRTVLLQNDRVIGVFNMTARPENIRAFLVRSALTNPSLKLNIQTAFTLRDNGTTVEHLSDAVRLVETIPTEELREQLVGCYEEWLEVCYAITGENRHFNPDEILEKIRQLKGE